MSYRVWLRFEGHIFDAVSEMSHEDEARVLAQKLRDILPSTVAMGVEEVTSITDYTGTAVLKESADPKGHEHE